MGLFDKRKKGRDDFDSPVEQIDLNAPDAPAMTAAADADEDDLPAAPTAASALSSSGSKAATRPAAAAQPARPRQSPGYGIDDAIALMRTLPPESVELVVQVVKHTLESAKIDIGTIIDDASGKQERIESRVAVLKDAIADLEREIATRRTEIGELEADHKETTRVKERLLLAQKLTSSDRGKPAAAPAPATAATPADPVLPGVNRPSRPTNEHAAPRDKPATLPPPIAAAPPSTTPAAGHTVIPKK